MYLACGLCGAEYVRDAQHRLKHPISECQRSGKTWLWFEDDEPMEYVAENGDVIRVCVVRFRTDE